MVRSRVRPTPGVTAWPTAPDGAQTSTVFQIVKSPDRRHTQTLTAEALTLAESSGLDLQMAINVMSGTIAGHGHLTITYPNKVLRGDLEAGYSVDLAHKDLTLAIRLAAQTHTPVPMDAAALQSYSAVRACGRGRQDYTAVYSVKRQMAGLPDDLPFDASKLVEYNPFSK